MLSPPSGSWRHRQAFESLNRLVLAQPSWVLLGQISAPEPPFAAGSAAASRFLNVPGNVGDSWCTAPMAERDATIAEGDEPEGPASDNSLGRLLALSDGVFAIAMTLLALDLRLPDLGVNASDAQLRHALGDDWRGYLAFVISFYVVANYWGVHRRAMRAVTTIDTRLIGHTLPLLLLVAALPFPASVLAT